VRVAASSSASSSLPSPKAVRDHGAEPVTTERRSAPTRFTRRAGELAFAPRRVPHTYANLSGTPARALLVITPAGFERYFDRIAARIAGSEPPPEALKKIPEVVVVGPPLGDEPTRS
jgi:hypothetical protein